MPAIPGNTSVRSWRYWMKSRACEKKLGVSEGSPPFFSQPRSTGRIPRGSNKPIPFVLQLKRPSLGWLVGQHRGHSGSRCGKKRGPLWNNRPWVMGLNSFTYTDPSKRTKRLEATQLLLGTLGLQPYPQVRWSPPPVTFRYPRAPTISSGSVVRPPWHPPQPSSKRRWARSPRGI